MLPSYVTYHAPRLHWLAKLIVRRDNVAYNSRGSDGWYTFEKKYNIALNTILYNHTLRWYNIGDDICRFTQSTFNYKNKTTH